MLLVIDGDNTQPALDFQHGNGQVAEVEPHVTHLLPGERELLAECHRDWSKLRPSRTEFRILVGDER